MTINGPTSPSRTPGWQIPLGIAAGTGIGMLAGIVGNELAMGMASGLRSAS